MSETVESKVMGKWHHPKIGKDPETGKAVFLPRMEYAKLLHNENFKIWHDTYRSVSSRRIAKLTVFRLMEAGALDSPDDFLKLEPHDAKTLVRKIVNNIATEGFTQGARQTQIFAKQFYNYHNEDLGRELKFKRSEKPKTIQKKIGIEVIPDRSQIYKMAASALGQAYKGNVKNTFLGYRNRALTLCLWQSGIRVNAICRLRYGMVKNNLYPTIKVPVPLKITQDIDTKISAYGLGYYCTFLADSAAKALREYLDVRVEITGHTLKDEDYLFATLDERNQVTDKPMKRHMVLHAVKVSAGRAGLKYIGIWTHVLRKSFRKVLNSCIYIDEDTREALMGHKLPGSRGNYFDVHDIGEISEKYMKADWTEGAPSRLNGLEKTVTIQEDTIKKLELEKEQFKARITKMELEKSGLEERMINIEKIVKELKQSL
jgi:integrase